MAVIVDMPLRLPGGQLGIGEVSFTTKVSGYFARMTAIGYTMMCEQAGPKALVTDVQAAEDAGFDFAVISDHYFPWVEAMGHSPYAWSVLGAAAHATSNIDLMSFVTCPIKRYHPAVVAQKAATVSLMSDGRFTLGLGSGENLNEHVTGGGWPSVDTRHEMLREAVDIINSLFAGGYVSYKGRHFDVESAKLWDRPPEPPGVGIAVSGKASCQLAGEKADVMIGVQPDAKLSRWFEGSGGKGKPRVGQLPVAYDTNRNEAIERARRLFGWFGGGWKVNSELPGTAAFEAASQYVRKEDIAEAIPCGHDVDEFVAAVDRFRQAGYTHLALVQVGGSQQLDFVQWAQKELLPALRK